MSELVVVANRGPATLYQDETGATRVRHAAGGLAPSLGRALEDTRATWVAVATNELERRAAVEGMPETDADYDLRLVDIDATIADAAMRVIANGTLWFCYHDLFDRSYRPVFNRVFHQAWAQFRSYNAAIAAAISDCADEGATVVVNDYQLSLVGAELARGRPDLRTVHFCHTPFSSANELRVLPSAIANELIAGLCSYGACGFHTDRWASQFASCVEACGASAPELFVAPLGVDASSLQSIASSPGCVEKREALLERLADRKLLLRSDRLELSKNVVRGFLAFEELLAERPSWVGRVVFVARVYPSREDLPEYLAYRSVVERVVERINERFSSGDYVPIELVVQDDFEASIAAASCYDVLLVNPLRDGMNLVAKEGSVVNRNDGVLVLSKEAGSYDELGEFALGIEPFDVSGTAAALERALSMEGDERRRRAGSLASIGAGSTPDHWFRDVVAHARLAPAAKKTST